MTLHTPPEAASLYVSLGWYPIPLKPQSKDLRDRDGLDRVYEPSEFEPTDNVGLRLVSSLDKDRQVKLIAVDFDAQEIWADAVWSFLPPTGGWGRPGKPISQVLFTCPVERSLVHKDQVVLARREQGRKATLIEVRASHQSMCPPSVHPNGEQLQWLDSVRAEPIAPERLRRAFDLLATTAMVARYYKPPGARHEWCLYLAGFLLNLGVTEEEASTVIRCAASVASDQDVKDRLGAVHSTYAHGEEDPVAGSRKLAEDMGEIGQLFVATLRKVWGAASTGFETNLKGDKVATNSQNNIRRALERMKVVLTKDEFADQMLVARNGSEAQRLSDGVLRHLWLETEVKFGFLPKKDFFWDVAEHIADQHRFHPVLEYLATLKWDGKPRIGSWLHTYGGAKDTELIRAVGTIVLIAAVRRVRDPGCKFDELMVLESKQGLDKSTALRSLCPNEGWFSDDLPLGVDAKQIIERTAGRWIIEIAELVGNKRESDHLKASLSRQVDGPVRLAYAREPVAVPRKFIVIGTTNSSAYLKDYTGNRRFWPVSVKKFDVAAIRRDRDQLWAEAAQRESEGVSIRLDQSLHRAAEVDQEERVLEDPWESALAKRFKEDTSYRILYDDVWDILGIPLERRSTREQERLIICLKRLGFRSMTVRDKANDRVVRGWGRDADLFPVDDPQPEHSFPREWRRRKDRDDL